jgi:aspartate racemase
MHKIAPVIEAAIDIPLLHIADATADHLAGNGIKTVGLLGTAITMEHDFYKGRLTEKYGLTVLVPEAGDREIVHKVIYSELCLGKIIDHSKTEYLRIIRALARRGAEAVVLGCTEIGMLVKPQDTDVLLCDTAEVHAKKAVEYAIREPA